MFRKNEELDLMKKKLEASKSIFGWSVIIIVRLAEESQNTKLLKIKHKERGADKKYREKQQQLT